MKKFVTKKIILIGSGLLAVVSLAWEYVGNRGFCMVNGTIDYNCLQLLHDARLIIIPVALFLFVFSLLTYFAREEVFRTWWNFTRWTLPVFMVVSIVLIYTINSMGSRADMFDRGFASLFFVTIYAVLILGSLRKIIRTNLRFKKEVK